MGRSGGIGGRSGGGGGTSRRSGGGYHHHSPSRHYHHSPPRHYHHSPTRHYYSSGGSVRCGSNVGTLCVIPLFILLVIVVVICILAANPSVTISTTLTQCEQVITCPDSLRSDSIDFTSKSHYATAYLVKNTPKILSNKTTTHLDVKTKSVASYGALYNSFNLVSGSKLSFDIRADRYFTFYIVEGEDEYEKFKNYEEFHYLRMYDNSYVHDTFVCSSSAEYFGIVDASHGSLSFSTFEYDVEHAFYDLSGNIKNSSSSSTFSVDDSLIPGACLLVDMPCDVSDSAENDIEIYYELDRSGLFWACLVFTILFALGIVGAIVACVVCGFIKKSGSTGTTYQTINSSSPAQAPAYPAGYQQPQPPAAYNPAAPVYPTAGGVDPSATAPVYAAGVDPSATAPMYATGADPNAGFNPGYAPSYGTATVY